jgi:phosphohistidine swiveling domain-containing protein
MRGIAKRSFLQALDVARVSARRIGEHLEREGILDAAEDVWFLTADELGGAVPTDARELVARRRDRRKTYLGLDIPSDWAGMPEPLARQTAAAASSEAIHGVGVSPGVVEGRARVLTSPDFSEVRPDEILVAPTTDPGWSSIMFISSALVVDIGGALSHAAVVAREMNIPCVVNTRNGTSRLRTGDHLRVDGSAGTVEIMQRAQS